MKKIALLLPLIFLAGCASQPPVTAAPTKPKIKRIAVQTLIGPNKVDFTPEMMAALQGGSVVIVGKSQPADALLIGEVMNYKTGRKLMVFLGPTQVVSKNQAQTLSNPVFSSGSGQIIPQTPTSGGPIPRMVTENAVVHMRMRLLDAFGKPIWVNEYSYEGLDIAQVRRVVISALVQSLKRAIPDLQPATPVNKS